MPSGIIGSIEAAIRSAEVIGIEYAEGELIRALRMLKDYKDMISPDMRKLLEDKIYDVADRRGIRL